MEKSFLKNSLFSTPLFEFNNLDLAKELKGFIGSHKIDGIESNVANHIKHNLSESKFNFFNSEEEVIKKTRTYLASCLKDVLNDLIGSDNDYKIAFSDSWYHIGTKNSSHDVHAHINCSWCGIYYIQSGESNNGGQTFFCNPIFSNFLDEGTLHHNDTEHIITPEDGKLILFPSYLKHFQSMYTGEMERIVVAFNCTILEKH
tara:strand:+ start:197 stop:802 length:606 start_codon:yes stop_codon:yes gene_type:complete